MALNSSGPISLAGSTAGQSIALEINQGATTQISLNDSAVRTLAGVASGAITMPTNFYGKSSGLSGTITYSLGTAGAPGVGSSNGTTGGTTTITYTPSSVSLTANGGEGGYFNNNLTAAGGTASGGSSNSTGGTGKGSSGDSGGGGGGGTGGANATSDRGSSGDDGAQSNDIMSLFAVLSAAGYATTTFGAGAPSGSGGQNNRGGDATGFGCGGGGAGYWGGGGGNGLYGGGGGGSSGYGSTWTGGTGGQGVVVLQFYDGSTYTNVVRTSGSSYAVPAGTKSIKFWAIGAGGGGSGATSNDGDSGGGGGAGGIAYTAISST